MTSSQRIVIDNNIHVSGGFSLRPPCLAGSPQAIDTGQLLVSDATLAELADVTARPKFDDYVTIADRQGFIRPLGRVAERVPVIYTVHTCRDSEDTI
jgi:predicted nucleic acid-binding protein